MLLLVIAAMLAYPSILYGITEFPCLSLIVSEVKEAPQDTVAAVVSGNYASVYHGLWEGYSSGCYTEGYGLEEAMDIGGIYYHLDETLGIRRKGGNQVRYIGGALEYKITGLDVKIRNAFLTPPDPVNVQRFEADAVVWLEIPVQLVGETFLSMKVKLEAQAGYIEVF